jgi:hypothetical protein
MIDLRAATADEMILAFLQGEVDSPSWKQHYVNALEYLRTDRLSLIDHGELSNPQQNAARRFVLGSVRGYGRNEMLFRDFPDDTNWRLTKLTPAEVAQFKYINERGWIGPAGSRLVADRANNLDQAHSHAIRTEFNNKADRKCSPLIVAQCTGDPDIVIIEGHHRATAYAMMGAPDEIEAFIGTSAHMARWHWWG